MLLPFIFRDEDSFNINECGLYCIKAVRNQVSEPEIGDN